MWNFVDVECDYNWCLLKIFYFIGYKKKEYFYSWKLTLYLQSFITFCLQYYFSWIHMYISIHLDQELYTELCLTELYTELRLSEFKILHNFNLHLRASWYGIVVNLGMLWIACYFVYDCNVSYKLLVKLNVVSYMYVCNVLYFII